MVEAAYPKEILDKLFKTYPQGIVAFDLETTGLSPLIDKIVEISAVKITPSGIEIFDQLVDPKIPMPEVAQSIHGISDEEVAGRPTIDEILPKFLEFSGGLPLVAHNAKFDAGYILFNLHLLNQDIPVQKILCTCQFARLAFPDLPSHKLSFLAEELGLGLDNHHRALADAKACLSLYIKCLERKRAGKLDLLFNLGDFSQTKTWSIDEELQNIIIHQRVEIMYQGGSHKGKFRPINPVAFLPMPNGPVLYAHCLISDMYKSFIVKKIAEFRIPNEK